MTPETWVVIGVGVFLLMSGYFAWKGERHQRGRRVLFSAASLGVLGVVYGIAPDTAWGAIVGGTAAMLGWLRASLEKGGAL